MICYVVRSSLSYPPCVSLSRTLMGSTGWVEELRMKQDRKQQNSSMFLRTRFHLNKVHPNCKEMVSLFKKIGRFFSQKPMLWKKVKYLYRIKIEKCEIKNKRKKKELTCSFPYDDCCVSELFIRLLLILVFCTKLF